jgi:PAS domain S-box-containing protein/putative nucleotidyltransferase with HDIG domain
MNQTRQDQTPSLRVLLVEDDEDEYLLLRDMLGEIQSTYYRVDWYSSYEAGRQALMQAQYDVCLLDYRLGARSGLDLLQEVRARECDRAILLLTGQGDRALDLEAMEAGAADYLAKGDLNAPLLERSIRYAIKHQRTVAELRSSERRFRALIENASDAITLVSADGSILYTSPSTFSILGYRPDEFLGRSAFELIHPHDLSATSELFRKVLERPGARVETEYRLRHRNGAWRCIECVGTNLLHDPSVGAIVTNYRDVTERKTAEARLRESEEQYRTLFETMAQGVVYQDASGQVITANPAAERILGVTVPQMQGHAPLDPCWSTIQEDGSDFPSELHPPKVALRTGSPVHGVVYGVFNPTVEAWRWILVSATPQFREGEDRPYQVFTTFDDITERKQAEEALRASEVRFRALIENSSDGIALLDLEGIIRYISPSSSGVLGYTADEIVGRMVLDLVHPDDLDYTLRQVLEVVQNPERSVLFEHRLRHRDGSWRWIEAHDRNLVADPAVQGIVVNFRDISERKAAEAALQEANARAIREYRHLLDRLATLAQAVGTADDLISISRALLDFVKASAPCNGIFVALYDAERQERRCIYAWSEGEEEDVGQLPVLPMTGSPNSRAALTGEIIVTDDFQDATANLPVIHVGMESDPAAPRSSIAVPMKVLGRVVGTYEVQSTAPAAYTDEHVIALRMAGNLAAIAIESLASLEREREQTLLAEALRDTAELLASTVEPEAVLDRILDNIGQVVPYDAASVMLVEDKVARIVRSRGFAERGLETAILNQALAVDGVKLAHMAASGEALIIPELGDHADWADLGIPRWQRSHLSVPIRSQGRLIGVLNVDSESPAFFTERHAARLQALANQAAAALENARLLQETERRLQRLAALREMDNATLGALDLRVIMDVLLKQVTDHLEVDAADILLLDRHALTLSYVRGRGFGTRGATAFTTRLGQGVAGQVALERKSIYLPDLQETAHHMARPTFVSKNEFASYYGVPLIAKGQLLGILEVFHRQPLKVRSEWEDFLHTLAGQAAIAIDNATLFTELQGANLQLHLAYDATIEGWSEALDLRDKETEGHSQRVTELTVALARQLGMSDDELVHVRRGALLHDIGKMGVPDAILLKPGPLTDEEWVLMRQHPTFAYALLSKIQFLRPALDIPYCHHEKWDGSGYPRGLSGEQIPMAARIFAVVDVWDALTSDRPYRKAWSPERASAYIQEQAGSHFDRRVVDFFLAQVAVGQVPPAV